MNVRFELTGQTALLMHQDDVEASDRLEAWRRNPKNKGVSKAGDDRSPGWTWQTYLYHDGEHITIPSTNLMVCLRQAGAQVVMKKQKTYKEVTQSGMFVRDEFLRFECGQPYKQIAMKDIAAMADDTFTEQSDAVRKFGFRLWAKRGKIGTAKHIRVRPRFDSWRVSGSASITAPELTLDVLRQLFDIAGRVGLCDWRPGCKTPGPFGMFTAKVTAE